MTSTPSGPAAVLDANGIIGLAKGGCFRQIARLFNALYLPSLVVLEISDPVSHQELTAALGDWLREETPTAGSLALVPPHKSEADRHVLALALDHRPALLVTGDRALQNKAKQLQVLSIDAPTVVRLLAEAHLVSAARPHLDQMRLTGFGIPQALYDEILRALGE